MEIVRRGCCMRDHEGLDAFSLYRDHIVLILQGTFDQQKGMMNDHSVILLK